MLRSKVHVSFESKVDKGDGHSYIPLPSWSRSLGQARGKKGSSRQNTHADVQKLCTQAGAPSSPDAQGPFRMGHLAVMSHQDRGCMGTQWLPISSPCCQGHSLAQGGCHAVTPPRDLGRMSSVHLTEVPTAGSPLPL